MYIDGRDSFLLAGLDRITEQFGSFRAPIAISAEGWCWPIAEWAPRFPKHPSGCHFINAGQWMGERDAVLKALAILEELHDRATSGQVGKLPDLARRAQEAPHDDQVLWHIAWLNGLIEAELDYEGRLFCNVWSKDMSLSNNRDFDFTDGLVFRPSGRRPCALHFAGPAAQQCMHQWGGLLGAY
jgi:hypothetical protein